MGTRGYAAYLKDGDEGVLAFNMNLDSHPVSLGEGMVEVARRRARHPEESLVTSMQEGVRGFFAGMGEDPAMLTEEVLGTTGLRNFLRDRVYCEYAYIVDLDNGRFEAWGHDDSWYSTDTAAARVFPKVAARHPHRPLLGVFPLDVPADWIAIMGWPDSYQQVQADG